MPRPVLGLPFLALLTAATVACGRDAAPPAPARDVTDAMLRAAPGTGDAWLSHGHDWTNQRYAPLTEIDRRSVSRLEKLWQHRPDFFPRPSVRSESTPIAVDDLLLYTDHNDLVLAVDVRTGRERWRYQPKLGPAALCCGLVNRGLAVYGDKAYLATLDARLIALNRRNGSVAWDVRAADPAEGYSFTVAPLAADGKIIVGVSGGELSIRGFVDAYDPETGQRLWRFWTVPSPEDGGWYGPWSPAAPDGEPLPRDIAREKRDSARFADAWRKGGGPVWSTPAYDPDLKLLIAGTGNPSGVDREIPPGDNLYTTSLIALDIATGSLVWYYQMVPHNLWDLDAASPPILFDLAAGGSTIPAVAQAGKTGWIYILDRRTGRQIRRSEPFIPLENVFAQATKEGVRMSPAVRGGSTWPPNAYSPQTGMFYVLGSYIPMLYILDSTVRRRSDGELKRLARFDPLPDSVHYGLFSAVDMRTGKVRWQKRVPGHLTYSGALATQGGLVFFGEQGGWLDALDAETGETLWRFRAGKGYLGPPITFRVDGRQRIAVTSRQGLTLLGLP
jgi:alcohol dehydrogenase (cytochrome c)